MQVTPRQRGRMNEKRIPHVFIHLRRARRRREGGGEMRGGDDGRDDVSQVVKAASARSKKHSRCAQSRIENPDCGTQLWPRSTRTRRPPPQPRCRRTQPPLFDYNNRCTTRITPHISSSRYKSLFDPTNCSVTSRMRHLAPNYRPIPSKIWDVTRSSVLLMPLAAPTGSLCRQLYYFSPHPWPGRVGLD